MKKFLAGIALVLTLVACGQEPTNIGPEASSVLGPRVAALRAAAERGDRNGAFRSLEDVRSSVGLLLRQRTLTEQQARGILDAVQEVERNLGLIRATASPSPLRRRPTTAPSRAPSPPPVVETPKVEPTPEQTQIPEEKSEENQGGDQQQRPGDRNGKSQQDDGGQQGSGGQDGTEGTSVEG